jgi:hypothetical protein
VRRNSSIDARAPPSVRFTSRTTIHVNRLREIRVL